ncbi:hypothetical protein EDC04DRAFT_2633733 [Pisolithus marmoratus]|nr:hypothetical protein EDC04DRAFT_2633733 [Pisolithus marmoratus]
MGCMLIDPSQKYQPYIPLQFDGRKWPTRTLQKAPIWLSTDLRDGNQALANPMTADQKLTFFRLLVKCGFKEIEIAYPAASDTDFNFTSFDGRFESIAGAKRVIIHMYNCNMCIVPQRRLSQFQRADDKPRSVPHQDCSATSRTNTTASYGTTFRYEYSPETFSQTEVDFSVAICDAVKLQWGKAGTGDNRIIFNLPATVEVAPPNHYADQIEYFCTHISEREHVVVSLHPHNDRGTGIAAAELAVLGGADRIEGCLFGNGERNWKRRHRQSCAESRFIRVNSQSGKGGIAFLVKQHLDLDLPRKMQIAFYQVMQAMADREAREMTVEDITTTFRSTYYFGDPKYEGRLALKSFNITTEPSAEPLDEDEIRDEHRHIDGTIKVDGVLRVVRGDGNGPISALLDALRTHLDIHLTLREYSEHTIGDGQNAKGRFARGTSQSWWGVGVDSDITASGLRAVLSAVNGAIGDRALPELKLNADVADAIVNSLGLQLPRRLQASFFEVVRRAAVDSSCVTQLFKETYGYEVPHTSRFELLSFNLEKPTEAGRRRIAVELLIDSEVRQITGEGNGPLSALLAALHSQIKGALSIREYSEHSIGEGAEVTAVSFVELVYEADERSKKVTAWGIGHDSDITASGLRAVLRAASSSVDRVDEKA